MLGIDPDASREMYETKCGSWMIVCPKCQFCGFPSLKGTLFGLSRGMDFYFGTRSLAAVGSALQHARPADLFSA